MGNFFNCPMGVQGGELAGILPYFVPQRKRERKNN